MNTRRIETPAEAYDREFDLLVDQGVANPYTARQELGERPEESTVISSIENEAKHRQTVRPLGVKAVEVSVVATLSPRDNLKEVTLPADWRPASRKAATGPQHGDSEADGGKPHYFEPYDKARADAAAENVRHGREIIAPVLADINTRVVEKKLNRARGIQ
jgi:hypothetical protein